MCGVYCSEYDMYVCYIWIMCTILRSKLRHFYIFVYTSILELYVPMLFIIEYTNSVYDYVYFIILSTIIDIINWGNYIVCLSMWRVNFVLVVLNVIHYSILRV